MRTKKAIVNLISSVTLQLVTLVCGFIVPRLIIGSFGSNVNGLVNSIIHFLAYITLLESGVGPVVKSVLYKPIANKNKTTIQEILKASENFFRKIAIIFLVYIIVLCIILPFVVSNEFNNVFTISLVLIIGISTFVQYYFGITYKLYLQAEQRTYITSIIQMGTLIVNTVLIVALIRFGVSIQIVKLVSTIIFVLRPVLQNIYVKKKYKINLKQAKENYKIKQKWDGLAQHIAAVVHENTDIVILTIYGNMVEVSVYSVYLLVINGVKNVIKSFTGGIDATFGDMIAKGEKENLNKSFKIYECLYFSVATIVFSCTLFLITPFVRIYTKGITDVNYIRPSFAVLMVIAELLCIIRQPYNDLVKVSGHFKQTQIGAWFEAISNVVISFVLVWKFGIIGVAIGTLFAMFIRTIEFMCYTSKHILERSIWYSTKALCAIAIEVIIISIIMNFIPKFEVYSYGTWMLNAIVVAGISTVIVCVINLIVHKESCMYILSYLKKRGVIFR